MKFCAMLLAAALLAGCATTSIPYTPSSNAPPSPHKLVQRVLHEQPTDYPPEAVNVTEDHFEVIGAAQTSTSRVTWRSTTHREVTRVYYRSIARMSLYQKRGTWYVVPEAADGRELATVMTTSEADAKQFIDALAALKARAS